jgi:hypothetical protein
MRAARQRGPVFPAPQARGLFARLSRGLFSCLQEKGATGER